MGHCLTCSDNINVGSMFITDCILYVWASPHLPCAEQDWFGMMTFLRLIGRWAKQSVSDPIPEGVSFHSAYMHRDTQSGYHSPSPQACSPMWAKGQNHLGWSSGLRLHLLFLLQSCDPELVYMCSPETQTQRSLASMWNRSRNVLPQLFSVRRFYPVFTLKRN